MFYDKMTWRTPLGKEVSFRPLSARNFFRASVMISELYSDREKTADIAAELLELGEIVVTGDSEHDPLASLTVGDVDNVIAELMRVSRLAECDEKKSESPSHCDGNCSKTGNPETRQSVFSGSNVPSAVGKDATPVN